MIESWYENPNKPVVPVYNYSHYNTEPFYAKEAAEFKIDVKEYSRRALIITQLSNRCPYTTGSKVFPVSKEGMELYGECKVVNIVRNYKEIARDDWPATDNPYIITGETLDGRLFTATTNYFTTVRPTNNVC